MRARTLLETLRWLAGVWLLWSIPGCGTEAGTDPDDGNDREGGVTVVVPARDEEDNLPALLASLAVQHPPPDRVVVVDDHSSDGTATVAAAAGPLVTVVRAPELPEGWTGKCWACWTGTGGAADGDGDGAADGDRDGSTLVFLDADTVLEPGGLGRLLREHRRRGGLVSVQPFHVTERPYEAMSAYFNVVAMMGVDAFNPLARAGRIRPAGAFGACLVCSKADYLAAGGHRSVRSSVLEDVALARRFQAAGRAVTCLGGRGTVRFRMYPAGLGQLVEGWTKNFASGAAASRPITLLLVVVWVSGGISASGHLGTALVRGRSGGAEVLAAGAVHAAYAVQLWWMLRRLGRFPWWTPPLFPAPLVAFLAVFARSVVRTLAGEVRWRGRAVATGRRARAAALVRA